MTALLIGSPLYAQKYKIALIHSYQEGYSGAGIVNKLFVKGLKDQQIDFQLRTFYLDCEKYESVEEERRISEFADSIRSWGGDLIAVLDDQATYSVMACGNPYVRQVPVVFSGVNYPNQELLAQYPNITGYIDKPDYLTTCRMIERIMGKVRIHILNGRTVLDRLIWKDLSEQCKGSEITLHQWKRQEARPDKLNIPISDKDDTEYESLYEKLNEYNQLDSTVVVRLSSDSVAARDLMWLSSGVFQYSLFLYTKRDYTTLRIGSLFDNPGFETINEGFGIKEYMLGGYFAPIETQLSDMTAGIKERLQGKIPVPAVKQIAKQYLVNWQAMKRYQIPLESIPPEYTIMYRPWREKYATPILILESLLVFTLLLGIAYLIYIYTLEKGRKKEALRNLRFEHEALTLALEGGNTYAWCFDGKTAVLDQAFCELTNRSQNLLGIEEIAHYVHPDEQARFRKNVSNILYRQRRTAQYRCQFNDTGYQWWEFRYSVLQNNEQNPIITGLLVNIQEIKDKEEELIRARKLAEQAELKQSFLANMSHEIRTPLNAIVGFSNLLTTEKNISEEEKKEFASIIDNNTRLLLKLVNDVLELSRIESGNMSFHCEDCSAHHFAETVYQTHQVIILPPVEFIKEFPDEDVTIHIDRMRLTQVITNFLGNAKKFTSQGHIKLGYFCDKEKKEIHFFVEDTGAGIPKEELQMIFERFYKRNEFVQGGRAGTRHQQGHCRKNERTHRCAIRGEQGQPFHRRTALSVILFLCRLFRQGELQDQIRQHTRQHRSQYDTHLCLRQQHRRIPEREVGYEQRNRKTDTSQKTDTCQVHPGHAFQQSGEPHLYHQPGKEINAGKLTRQQSRQHRPGSHPHFQTAMIRRERDTRIGKGEQGKNNIIHHSMQTVFQ